MRHATKGLLLAILVPALMAATMPVGSLTTFGQTSISGVSVQSGTAVFAGDVITTGPSSAVFSLPNGRTVQIGPNSALQVSKDSTLSMLKGMSRIQAKSANFIMVASNWKLDGQPGKSGLTADVVSEPDGRVSLNVSSGKIVASSFRGNVVMVAEAGRPVMLPSEAPSTGPSDPPQGGGSGSGGSGSSGSGSGNHKGLIIGAFVVGAVGLAVGAAALASEPADQTSQVSALSSQVASLSSHITALNSQITSLTATVNLVVATAASLQAAQALVAQLNAQLATLFSTQATLNAAQVTINGFVAQLAAGTPLTPTQLSQLAAAQATASAASASISSLTNTIQNLINQINKIVVPSPSAPHQ